MILLANLYKKPHKFGNGKNNLTFQDKNNS
jgi:hypothetical protein